MNALQEKVQNYLNELEGKIKTSSLTYDDVRGPCFKPEIKQKIINSCQKFLVFNLRSFSDRNLDVQLNEGFYWVIKGKEIFLELTSKQNFEGDLFVKFPSWVMPMKEYRLTGIMASFIPPILGDQNYFLVIDSRIARDNSQICSLNGIDFWCLNLNDNRGWKVLSGDELKEVLDSVTIPPQNTDNMKNKTKFYHKGQDNYGFTNFAPARFTILEIPPNLGLSPYLTGEWTTSEHLFQAAKFTDQAIIERIRGTTTAKEVFNLANSATGLYRNQIRSDWHNENIKLGVMKWVVKEKFTQNEKLKEELLKTGNNELIEDTESDTTNSDGSPKEPRFRDQYWGNATKYDRAGNCLGVPGDNHLGKILMEIRQELTSNPTPPPQFPNDIPRVPKPSEKENLKNLIKASNGWEEWNNNYQKVSSFNFQEQQELAEELLNSLAKIINSSNDLTTLNSLQSNWRNHNFYTQNSERAVKIDQFYNNRRQEIEQKTTSSSSSQPKNNFLTDHWQIILIVFLAFIISIAFIQRRKKVKLKK